MSKFVHFTCQEHNLLLTAEKTVFWEEEKILILSDLHLGKTGHFRKSGIGVPQKLFREDLQRLFAQIQYFKPQQLLVVGDLFHSTVNQEHDLFLKWRRDIPAILIQLVKGNHDILDKQWYRRSGIAVSSSDLKIRDFVFTHDISVSPMKLKGYYFSGHIHPGIKITGLGKQSLQFPCFYFGKKHAILPAFGKFTGTHAIKPGKGDVVFAIVKDEVMKMG